MAAAIKPIKTSRRAADLQRSVRIWEGKRAKALANWRATTKKYKKTDKRRIDAWSKYSHANNEYNKARGKLLYRQKHPQTSKRQRCVNHAVSFHNKVTEKPPGSNRGGMITAWQQRFGSWLLGTPWCGTFCGNMLLFAGVKGVSGRIASVALIEDDARAGRGPFASWASNHGRVHPGDLVVLFGRGVHVGMVRSIKNNVVYTIEGNTSSGTWGSQSNGGGVYKRARPISQVHGFAIVKFPS